MVLYFFSLLYVINIKVYTIMYYSILFFFIGIWDFTRFNGYVMISLTLLSLSLGTRIFLWVYTQSRIAIITEVTGIWLKEVLLFFNVIVPSYSPTNSAGELELLHTFADIGNVHYIFFILAILFGM